MFEHGGMEGKPCPMRWGNSKFRTGGIIIIIIIIIMIIIIIVIIIIIITIMRVTLESYWQGFDGLSSQQGGGRRGPVGRCRRVLYINHHYHDDHHCEDGEDDVGNDGND